MAGLPQALQSCWAVTECISSILDAYGRSEKSSFLAFAPGQQCTTLNIYDSVGSFLLPARHAGVGAVDEGGRFAVCGFGQRKVNATIWRICRWDSFLYGPRQLKWS